MICESMESGFFWWKKPIVMWNLQKLFVPSSAAPIDTMVHPSPWNIEMADIRISNVEASIIPKDSLKAIPRFTGIRCFPQICISTWVYAAGLESI